MKEEKNLSLLARIKQFLSQEDAMGIGVQNFGNKFVFHQNSGTDAMFLDINTPSPSQMQGLSKKQQNNSRYLMAEIIVKAGEILKLPITTTIVALNLAQFYFTRKSFLEEDLRQISMGAVFLACKSQQTLRKSYQVAAALDYAIKMFQGIRPIKHLELDSKEYNYIKEQVIRCENQILFQLGFQVYKLFDIPHRYISGLIASFNRHKQCNEIVQQTWTYLNDIYRTVAPVYFPSQILGAAAVFMALEKLKIPMPQKPWWILMEVISCLVEEMYESISKNQNNFNAIEETLEKIGRNSLKIKNVFPVPYYRKISLSEKASYKKSTIKKEETKDQLEKTILQSINSQIQKRSKQTVQHSQQLEKKAKYQNDDQTPKVRKKLHKDPIKGQIEEQKKGENGLPKQSEGQKIQGQSQPHFKYQKPNIKSSKSMLSSISDKLKKLQVKKDINISLNNKVLIETPTVEPKNQNQAASKQDSSQSDDQILAQLIKKKKQYQREKKQANPKTQQ